MCLAAEETGWYLRSDICSIINGLDASILHYFKACDHTGFKPISYSAVQRQAFRFERIPFEELMAGIIPEYPPQDPDDPEDDDETGADLALLWFNLDILLATIPPRTLDKIRAGAVDATAFPTYARTYDFRAQKDVNKAVLEALKEKGTIPEDVTLGPDGKLIRCPHDPDARGGRRSPSLATGHKGGSFAGYFPTILTPSRDYEWTGDPQQIRLRDHISPYVLAFSVDPATRKKGPIARDLALAAKHVLPGFRALTGICRVGGVLVTADGL